MTMTKAIGEQSQRSTLKTKDNLKIYCHPSIKCGTAFAILAMFKFAVPNCPLVNILCGEEICLWRKITNIMYVPCSLSCLTDHCVYMGLEPFQFLSDSLGSNSSPRADDQRIDGQERKGSIVSEQSLHQRTSSSSFDIYLSQFQRTLKT